MRHLKLGIVITLISIIALFNGCENSNPSSVSGNADIASIIENLPEYLFNPSSLNEIFLEDAVLIAIEHSMHKVIFKGIKEIGTFHSTEGQNWANIKAIPKKIKVDNTQANVEYTISYDHGIAKLPWTCKCTAKL